ncbi:uncharacterized protein L969DRAFT_56103 [Mixia osmundae IAM 14324]|uniref:ubiquitinyl hydrolase 1 n=1 Tax=Mixia osmundae (strain CBS 9802 / IAM 14324 / JCM 22182 / KY 12970) TaxID=764103 RepID=G7E3X4_MIXOS|nr:uncharacterized protein L969DRAFT_56103 [Mixia osmundae IAM 14324]KEI41979.1 hypothetical protein L969DRAFT_56103 [Mixia osmundae IAM 14324]GAA97534.1 hypothetical protein E5Q_04212 [Mixia osmundae IAM 14324]
MSDWDRQAWHDQDSRSTQHPNTSWFSGVGSGSLTEALLAIGLLVCSVLWYRETGLADLRFIAYDCYDTLKGVMESARARLAALGLGFDKPGRPDNDLSWDAEPLRPGNGDSHTNGNGHVRGSVRRATSLKGKEPAAYGAVFRPAGLYNGAGGNACFLNSTLQCLASVSSLPAYLERVCSLGSSLEMATPVAESLLDIISELNAPSTSQRVLKPVRVARALFESREARRGLMNNEQQDAQEFLVMLIEAVSDELAACEAAARIDLGLGDVVDSAGLGTLLENSQSQARRIRSPFTGLMAHRISCMTCGYTEAVRHGPSDHTTLNVPPRVACTLDACLADYTRLELLDEFRCRRCTLAVTLEHYQSQLTRMSQANPDGEPLTVSKKKRLRDVRSVVNKLQSAIDNRNVEADIDDAVKIDKIGGIGPASKQSMFARCPPVLCIHLSRSTMYSAAGHPVKNSCQVEFRELLDFDPFSTGGILSTRPDRPISSMEQTAGRQPVRHLYRLSSVVQHYGSHSYGHYISYRRRPTLANSEEQSEWYRISDETVSPATAGEVTMANPFLLFYELVRPAAQARPVRLAQSISSLSIIKKLNMKTKEQSDDSMSNA